MASLPAPVTKKLPLDSLVDNPKNYKIHPINQLEAIAAAIRERGQLGIILVRTKNRMIITGHATRAAMRLAGETDGLCQMWDVDQATADRAMVADNRLAELGKNDEERLAELLRDVPTDSLQAMGFEQDEAEKLLAADKADEDLLIREIETGTITDTFWITVRGPLPLQPFALERLRDLMVEFPGIEVELGTTPGVTG